MSFGIKKGSVFGIVGPDNGKSVLASILAGDTTSSGGEIFFRGEKIADSLHKLKHSLAYCPKNDALNGDLTVR